MAGRRTPASAGLSPRAPRRRAERRSPRDGRTVRPLRSQEETRPAATDPAAHVLEQLDAAGDRAILEVDGHRVAVTNLDKMLWPGSAAAGAP